MARKTIEQRIALDGGKEILDTLKGLGKEGEKAFRQIQDAAKRAGSPGAALSKSVEKLRRDFVALGRAGQTVGRSFVGLAGAAGSFAGSLVRVGRNAALVTGALTGVAVGVVKFAQAGTQVADSVGKQAAAVGVAVDAYGRLQFAAEQSGVGTESLATALTRLNVKLGEAASGNQKTITEFRKLGVSIKDADGNIRPTEAILGDLAEKFRSLPDGAAKSALAVKLFGRSGAQLIPFLNEGRAGLDALGRQAEDLGLIFSAEQVRISTVFNDSLSALDRARKGLQGQLGILFAPALTEASEALQKAIVENKDAILELADGAIKRAVPLIKDFINALAGNEADVENAAVLEFVRSLKKFASEAGAAITGIVVPAFEAFLGIADKVAGVLNSFTGSEFTGQQVLIGAAVLKLVGAFDVLSTGIGLVASVIGTVVTAFKLIGPVISVVGSTFGVLAAAAKVVGLALAGIASVPALIVAAVVAAGVAIYVFFDEIVAGAKLAVQGIIAAIKFVGRGIAAALSVLGTIGREGFNLLLEGAQFAFGLLLSAVDAVVSGVVSAFRALPGFLSGIWDTIRGAAAAVWDYVSSAASKALGTVTSVFNALKETALVVWQRVVDIVFLAWRKVADIVSGGLDAAFDTVASVASAVWDGFKSAATRALDFVIGVVARLRDRIRDAFRALKELLSAEKAAGGGRSEGGGASSGFARGGMVRGPGTGTSDSIRAWLSNNEFVVRAKAVRHYGPQLLHAINRMKLPQFPAFANGGLVSAGSMPSLDMGQLASSFGGALSFTMPQIGNVQISGGSSVGGRPVVLQFPGETIEGLVAPDDVVGKLSKVAARQKLASLGRRPSWYGS